MWPLACCGAGLSLHLVFFLSAGKIKGDREATTSKDFHNILSLCLLYNFDNKSLLGACYVCPA